MVNLPSMQISCEFYNITVILIDPSFRSFNGERPGYVLLADLPNWGPVSLQISAVITRTESRSVTQGYLASHSVVISSNSATNHSELVPFSSATNHSEHVPSTSSTLILNMFHPVMLHFMPPTSSATNLSGQIPPSSANTNNYSELVPLGSSTILNKPVPAKTCQHSYRTCSIQF